jgi:hypothetical protein
VRMVKVSRRRREPAPPGICTSCHLHPARIDRKSCEQCAKYKTAAYGNKEARGLCTRCGIRNPTAGFKMCEHCRNYSKNAHRRAKYGISIAGFRDIVTAQGGRCLICDEPDPTHLDHDHSTGVVRGALCKFCNWMLGAARDNVKILLRGADYLESNKTK